MLTTRQSWSPYLSKDAGHLIGGSAASPVVANMEPNVPSHYPTDGMSIRFVGSVSHLEPARSPMLELGHMHTEGLNGRQVLPAGGVGDLGGGTSGWGIMNFHFEGENDVGNGGCIDSVDVGDQLQHAAVSSAPHSHCNSTQSL